MSNLWPLVLGYGVYVCQFSLEIDSVLVTWNTTNDYPLVACIVKHVQWNPAKSDR